MITVAAIKYFISQKTFSQKIQKKNLTMKPVSMEDPVEIPKYPWYKSTWFIAFVIVALLAVIAVVVLFWYYWPAYVTPIPNAVIFSGQVIGTNMIAQTGTTWVSLLQVSALLNQTATHLNTTITEVIQRLIGSTYAIENNATLGINGTAVVTYSELLETSKIWLQPQGSYSGLMQITYRYGTNFTITSSAGNLDAGVVVAYRISRAS
jgi:hypothetical protein